MLHIVILSACTAALAAAGLWIGQTIHGTTLAAAVPTIAGAAGGFGIGCAALDIARRVRSFRQRATAQAAEPGEAQPHQALR